MGQEPGSTGAGLEFRSTGANLNMAWVEDLGHSSQPGSGPSRELGFTGTDWELGDIGAVQGHGSQWCWDVLGAKVHKNLPVAWSHGSQQALR